MALVPLLVAKSGSGVVAPGSSPGGLIEVLDALAYVPVPLLPEGLNLSAGATD